MDKQAFLLENYTQQHGRPQSIVLYSWLMPCSTCTNVIVNAFRKTTNADSVIVAYTADYKAETPYNNKRNRQNLTKANITVIRVKYNHPLPPVY